MKHTLIFALCLCLAGCGFHLRGTANHEPLPFTAVHVTPQSKEPLMRNLFLSLESLDIHQDTQSPWQLEVGPPKLKTYPVAYGPNGELVREKLRLKVSYQLLHNQEVVLQRMLVNERHHQLNIATKLADKAELDLILNEMEHDLVQRMIIQMSRV